MLHGLTRLYASQARVVRTCAYMRVVRVVRVVRAYLRVIKYEIRRAFGH